MNKDLEFQGNDPFADVENDYDTILGWKIEHDLVNAWELDDAMLEGFFKHAIERYRALEPVISDSRFDEEFVPEMVKRFGKDHPLLAKPEAEPQFGQLVKHTRPMLSTDKAYTDDERRGFASRLKKAAVEIGLDPDSLEVRVTPKLDGLSGVDDEGLLLTRGNNGYGSDVTDIFGRGVVPIGGRGQGVGEIVMDEVYFQKLKSAYPDKKLMHPRNVVGGIVKAESIKSHAEEALKDGAVMFVPYSQLNGWSGSLDTFLDDYERIRNEVLSNVMCRTDGIVVEATDEALKAHMGHSSHHHLWQLACKTQGESADVKVLAIRCQTGRTGIITPVIEYEPVELCGAVLSKATAHHITMLQEKKINVGATIRVVRSGDVIPFVTDVVIPSDTTFTIERCPCCGSPAMPEGLFMRCRASDCAAQAARSMEHFFKLLHGIKGFGSSTCDQLVLHGVSTLLDVYALTENDFYRMDFGQKQSQNLRSTLDQSLVTPIEQYLFLAAFGIEGLGRGDSRHLLDAFSFDDLPSLTIEQVVSVDGFGVRKAALILEGIKKAWPTIEWLRQAGMNLIPHQQGEEASGDSPISNKSVVFTGTMVRGTRSDMESEAKSLGATVKNGVTKNTDYLVCGGKVGATKMAKANKLGVTILTEDEYLNLLNEQAEAA